RRAGRHPRYGAIYFWCLVGVFLTATGLAARHFHPLPTGAPRGGGVDDPDSTTAERPSRRSRLPGARIRTSSQRTVYTGIRLPVSSSDLRSLSTHSHPPPPCEGSPPPGTLPPTTGAPATSRIRVTVHRRVLARGHDDRDRARRLVSL